MVLWTKSRIRTSNRVDTGVVSSKKEAFISLFLFFISMNFYNQAYKLIVLLFFLLLIFPNRRNYFINKTSNTILLFCFSCFIFTPNQSLKEHLYFFLYYLCYVIGQKIVGNSKNINKTVFLYFISIALGCAFHGILSFVFNYKAVGLGGFERQMPDVWSGEDSLYGATAQAVLFILLGGTAYNVFFQTKKAFLLKAIYILSVIFLLLNGIYVASRSAILVPLVSFGMAFGTNILLSKRKSKPIIISTAIVVLLLSIFLTNMESVNSFLDTLPLFERVEKTTQTNLYNDPRLNAYSFFLNNMTDYPFGGLNSINPLDYMHNIWLDIYADMGIIPFVIFLIITFHCLNYLLKIFRSKKIDNSVKSLLIGVYTPIFLVFFTEPMIAAANYFVMLFMMILGMTDKYYKRSGMLLVEQVEK